MEIKAQRWIALLYRCPTCGSETASTRLTPSQRNGRAFDCYNWQCKSAYQVVERRYYTTFAIETDLNGTMVAGTLKEIGPFKVCDIRAFRKWVEKRRVELAEQSRAYMERERQLQVEYEARMKRKREEERLLKEATAIAYRREHAAELIAEEVARAVWPPASKQPEPVWDDGLGELDDDHPF